ncbi:MAG: thiamine pyrophosphate-binding protein [Spirochaetia bacterium]|nr:thiamine pyrophosphate-binding protein [Spirochaetia bacterium]
MKVSDLIFDYVASLGVKHVFYLPGGGAMHLDDSLGYNKKLTPICMLHEQACSIAAEAYARISGNFGVCVVTSGPGSTNAITGLTGAWLDGTPVIFISGQAKRADLVNNQNIRQFGIQEVNIVELVKSVTKYAVQIRNPEDILYELEKATAIARDGKPGPVWIDVPLDIQVFKIDENKLRHYKAASSSYECKDSDILETIKLLNNSKRPLVLLGHGIRLANAIPAMQKLIKKLHIPVMTTWNGVDLIEDSNPLFFGRPGAVGHRHANFIQQNADFVLTIGTRLNLLSTGYDFGSFLQKAKHVMVEIDANEMKKCSVHPYLAIHADAKSFLTKMLDNSDKIRKQERKEWWDYCKAMKKKYPLFIKEQIPVGKGINTYDLVNSITDRMTGKDIFQFTSSGTGADISMYSFRIKKGQRAFLTKGLASMGFDMSACIGSCLAGKGRRTVCITGDGGFLMNVQELATLKQLNLPIKIFILCNEGYGMIYNSQVGNFKRLEGCTLDSGLPMPDIKSVVKGFKVKCFELSDSKKIDKIVEEVLEYDGPAICTVKVNIGQKILPRQTNYMKQDGQMASRPLEDMSPLLDRDEFEANILK